MHVYCMATCGNAVAASFDSCAAAYTSGGPAAARACVEFQIEFGALAGDLDTCTPCICEYAAQSAQRFLQCS